jgi:thiol-disulfide isomerase/thioredoxin
MTGWYGRALYSGDQGANAFDEGRIRAIQQNLYKLVSEIEDFRSQNGRLPGNLQELSKTSSTNLVDLPTDASHEARPFYYLVLPDGRNYHLFSRGPDGEAFTADDILPILTNDEKVRWGYRVRPSDFSTLQSPTVPQVGSDETTQALDVLRWRDPEDGFAEAKRTRKPLLLDFTAEWCGWCRKLEADVLSNPEVARYVNQHFIPVKVMDRMNEDHKNTAFVAELQAKFSVRGFPTLATTSVDFQQTSVQRGYIGDPKRMLSFLSQFLER